MVRAFNYFDQAAKQVTLPANPENRRRNSIMWTPTSNQSAQVRPTDFGIPSMLIQESDLERYALFGRPHASGASRPSANTKPSDSRHPVTRGGSAAKELSSSNEAFWADSTTNAFNRAAELDARDVPPSGAHANVSLGGGQAAGALGHRNSFLPPGRGVGGRVGGMALHGRLGGMVGRAGPQGAGGRGRNFAPTASKGFLDYAG